MLLECFLFVNQALLHYNQFVKSGIYVKENYKENLRRL
jgi:hypothetical protein